MSARRLAVALHAVSTSPPMPDWPVYVERVEATRAELDRFNPRGRRLTKALADVARDAPAGSEPSFAAAELIVALSSFVDDYAMPPPAKVFEVDRAVRLLDALEGRQQLTAIEQLELALPGSTPLAAVLALHTAIRVLARGRDTRLHPRFAMSLDERLERGRAIAPFHPTDARGGDPLGDTYHFWANVAAGLYAASRPLADPRGHAVGGLLLAGPVLMRGVREGLFQNHLFFGDHARVDRLGLWTGYRLARRSRLTRR